ASVVCTPASFVRCGSLSGYLVSFSFIHVIATPEIYTLSLHDALPICADLGPRHGQLPENRHLRGVARRGARRTIPAMAVGGAARSEEHTSELQSRFDLVCRLLLEKKTRKEP